MKDTDFLIKAQNITVVKAGTKLLDNVSLSVAADDFITIIGPNGAGKTMLLKCLMGLYKPDAGSVVCKENLKIGYVPQRMIPGFAMPITVRRFITLARKPNANTLKLVATDTAIEDILDKALYVLSGGELQRVLLARALLDKPELLVLDEPAQNLDVSGQLAFYKLLEKIYNERKISILMVSHDLHLVMSCTRKVVCLFRHVCCYGEPQMVAKDPEFISLFGSDMAKMMAVYHHSHDHDHEHNNKDDKSIIEDGHG